MARLENAAVVHNPSKQRFEIDADGRISLLEYTFQDHRLFLIHAEVPRALERHGLGTKLAHAALELIIRDFRSGLHRQARRGVKGWIRH